MGVQIEHLFQTACKQKSAGWIAVLTPGDKHFTDDVNLAALKTVKQIGFFCQLWSSLLLIPEHFLKCLRTDVVTKCLDNQEEHWVWFPFNLSGNLFILVPTIFFVFSFVLLFLGVPFFILETGFSFQTVLVLVNSF